MNILVKDKKPEIEKKEDKFFAKNASKKYATNGMLEKLQVFTNCLYLMSKVIINTCNQTYCTQKSLFKVVSFTRICASLQMIVRRL